MADAQMVINYVPGEECRVAIVEDGKLEELYVERFATASRVGNIYVGRVMNVEPSIQAAFVDFGVAENGFLHVSDLHPRYFPGEDGETTERVGFKTPRRERPPIQAALRRGDEVIVQVLKEGVGSKGPTVTSYLSIPGRFLVMMPGMDNVGVSRKVEDEDLRRKMRDILDQLELPENFGFILRTAGMDRTKTELKRDLAYLQRLWKDMERRLKTGGGKEKTRLLYSESDLLVRSLRDLLTSDINEVVIDHEAALKRASRFMKIVAPRGSTKLMQLPGTVPIFHAFGIEKQIHLIHAREVPLPSGGRLVIDQTEALVAIDVNSGKSRDSRNSEDNAYQTNLEAVDEICRQLRLRDMGGIVINDLIDMRHASNRKDIENRFKERLKRDRARSTVLAISEFGILEMTRQRMRPSHESVHFSDCPVCKGRGMVQKPDSVAAEAMRDLCVILDLQRVFKVEMVVAPRVAGDLLSTKRQMISRVERQYGKHVDVRVSETVSVDRVSFYAYDEQGQDLELGEIPMARKPKDLVPWTDPDENAADWTDHDSEAPAADPEPVEEAVNDFAAHPIEIDERFDDGGEQDNQSGGRSGPGRQGEQSQDGDQEGGRKRRRRRGRRGRGGAEGDGPQQQDGRPQGHRQQGDRQPGDRQPQPQTQPQGQPQGQGRIDGRGDGRNDGRMDGRGGGRGDGRGQNQRPLQQQQQGPPSEHAHQRGGMNQRPIATTGLPFLQGDHGPEDGEASGPIHGDGGQHQEGMMPQDGSVPNGPQGGGEGGEADGGDGEGGRRRRRRRRRGGRGRGNGPEGFEGETPATSDAGPVAETSPMTDEQAADAFARAASRGGGQEIVGEPPRLNSDQRVALNPPHADGHESGAESNQGRGPEGGPDGADAQGEDGPRRRRRRGGRGGRGEGGGRSESGGGEGGRTGEPGNQSRPPARELAREPARESTREPTRDQAPRPEPRRESRPPSEAPRPAPKPAAPPPAAPAPAAPRTLYGGAKRKLSASQLNRRPKPE